MRADAPRRRGRKVVAVTVAVVVVSAAAAAVAAMQDDRGDPKASAAQPCRMFTKAELRRQFNVPPKRDAPGKRYPEAVRPGNSPVALVGADICEADGVYVGVSKVLAKESFAKWTKEAKGHRALFRDVKGLGTRAVWVASEFSHTLVVLQVDTVLIISDTTRARHGLQRAKDLARRALDEL